MRRCSLTLTLTLNLTYTAPRLLIHSHGQPRRREVIEGRLHIHHGTAGTAPAPHGVEARVLHEHHRVHTESLVEVAHLVRARVRVRVRVRVKVRVSLVEVAHLGIATAGKC